MARLSDDDLARIRRDNPTFDSDYALLEGAMRDCAIAYFWNPIVSPHEFEYRGWSTTLYAGIDEASRTAHVVFRGTDQLLDWAVNCAFVPLPLAHPLAHGGFVLAWKLAKRRFAPWLRANANRVDRVVITGHSLGGALALACAYELQCEGFHVERCITVGAPRLYTVLSVDKVAAVLGDRLMRVFKQQDLVPRLPPELLGFRHLGKRWMYVAELFGEREPEPFPIFGRWLERGAYYLTGGRVGDWLHENVFPGIPQAQMAGYALAMIASLGGAYALLVEVSVTSLTGIALLFALVSGALIALQAHRSGRYAATRKAASLVEEWQIHQMRGIAAGQPREPAGEGKTWVNLSIAIKASHGDDRKRLLVRNFRRFFGDDAFATSVGGYLEESLFKEARGGAADAHRGTVRTLPLELQFKGVCVALLLYGYKSEEIDRMIGDGVIRRPQGWTRYYAPATVQAPPAAADAAPLSASNQESRSSR